MPDAFDAISVEGENAVEPVPPFPTGSVPVIAAAVERLSAPHA